MKLRSIVESEANSTNKKLTDESDEEEESTNSDDNNDENNLTEDYDNCEISTTTEIITNVALRVKNRLVDLVDSDKNSILSSDVASSSDDKFMDEAVQVTPIRPNGDGKKVDTPRLGNMYGLMSILSPTTKKNGGEMDEKCIKILPPRELLRMKCRRQVILQRWMGGKQRSQSNLITKHTIPRKQLVQDIKKLRRLKTITRKI